MKPFFFETASNETPTIGDIETRLSGVSWLAMACYLEGIPYNELPLTTETLRSLESDLARIKAEGPLLAYTFCVRHLTGQPELEEEV